MCGLLLEFASHLREAATEIADPVFGHPYGALLDPAAFLDQRLKDLLAFFLGLGERAESSEPDLLRRFLDCRGELVVLARAFGHRFQFLDHSLFPFYQNWCASVEARRTSKQQSL